MRNNIFYEQKHIAEPKLTHLHAANESSKINEYGIYSPRCVGACVCVWGGQWLLSEAHTKGEALCLKRDWEWAGVFERLFQSAESTLSPSAIN